MSLQAVASTSDTSSLLHQHNVAVCGTNCPPVAGVAQHAGLGVQLKEFFVGLFDTSHWPARWHCGSWSDLHGWLYITSDLLIWASYFAIPLLLARLVTKRKDVPFPKIIWLFVAFIVLCGTTHLLDAGIFWWPAYRLSAFIRLITAIVSAFTVYAIYRVMPSVLSLRSVTELEHEIAERKEVEEKLAASKFLLKEAGRLGRVGGWEFDVIQQRSTWSAMVYEIYDLPENYIIDENDPFAFYIEPYKQQIKDALANAYAKGQGWDLELQMVTGKGANIWVRSSGECFYDESGKLIKLRGVIMDIDRYKTNEAELSKSHEMLFHSHQQLKTFTHILSHNIRNHASNISLLTGLVETDDLNAENSELFDKINRVSSGLNDTLNDLALAIKIREHAVESQKLSFREITGNVVEILESMILMNVAQVKYHFEVPNVSYPKLYLESIIMNLISNAIKYKRADVAPKILLKTYYNEQGKIVLECQDNGMGIDLKLHGDKVFGLYKTFHAHAEAHGVGLFLVKTQVESQEGAITVESTPGVGTTFKIVF